MGIRKGSFMSKFAVGQTVVEELHAAGFVTTENKIVQSIEKGKVWLSNGRGNDPSGPFDAKTGWHEDTVFGSRKRILVKK
jgi:hypothetical protein